MSAATSSRDATQVAGAWADFALSLPAAHADGSSGVARLAEAADGLPPVDAVFAEAPEGPGPEDSPGPRWLLALDVLMADAFFRRHGPVPPAVTQAALAVGASLQIPPILTYPLYIRLNPTDLGAIRRFTPTDDEFRFIRMHRLIEDHLDAVVARLEAIVLADDPASALVSGVADLESEFRLINRTVAAFRSPTRMDKHTFNTEFRPYFGSGSHPETGETLDGPSGLQSPGFRIVTMLAGYADPLMDRVTDDVMTYHDPAERSRLRRARGLRDDGLCLAALDRSLEGAVPRPHLDPDYGRQTPALSALAEQRGLVTPGILDELATAGVDVTEWPEGLPGVSGASPDRPIVGDAPPNAAGRSERPGENTRMERPTVGDAQPEPVDAPPELVDALLRCEAMLTGFHLEHVAITAHQIGYAQGTGGTAGVEFLLLATFRRLAPNACTLLRSPS